MLQTCRSRLYGDRGNQPRRLNCGQGGREILKEHLDCVTVAKVIINK